MTIQPELDEMIAAVESSVAKNSKRVDLANAHRMEQMLRILKFHRAHWDEMERRYFAAQSGAE